MRFTKKPVEIEAHQWFKNGDHPNDRVGELVLDQVKLFNKYYAGRNVVDMNMLPTKEMLNDPEVQYKKIEGEVVQFFRRPEPQYGGEILHDMCGIRWHDHGWIDTLEGGHTVCPGDWIITGVQGERYPCKPDIFDKTYDKVIERDLRPHSKACGINKHEHGTACHSNCPTCGGK